MLRFWWCFLFGFFLVILKTYEVFCSFWLTAVSIKLLVQSCTASMQHLLFPQLLPRRNAEPYHRITGGPLEVIQSSFLLRTEPAAVGCSGTWPIKFEVAPRMEHPQVLRAACSNHFPQPAFADMIWYAIGLLCCTGSCKNTSKQFVMLQIKSSLSTLGPANPTWSHSSTLRCKHWVWTLCSNK